MNPNHPQGDDERFDQAMHELHAQAVAQVSPPTRARLRAARHRATAAHESRRRYGWLLASGCAAVFALAIALQLQPRPASQPDAPPLTEVSATYDADTAVAALDENPDLYLWLASNDDALPAAEQ
ncbi:anti-sigma-K factor RskA [Lysobacter niastensis]|uniref:Anti-sigma-K factor RskA n=1 Tax=Lysobacter niastensis TaxID=380629 RepID=A0ABU1WBE8_9GAMM|nr:hypothetical protein [Lysobacter niastensis]MDR7134888.1 anti-sigma-K factor RskA [Lysobacter niastensis]